MPARLTIHYPRSPAHTFALTEGTSYVLGRAPDCDLHVDDPRVSRRHARFQGDPEGWTLFHLDSKNGLTVDGVSCEETTLGEAAWIGLGGLPGRFERVSEAVQRQDSQRELNRWQATLRFQARLDPAAGLGELLHRLLDSVLDLSGADRGLVLLRRPDGELVLRASTGLDSRDLCHPSFSASVGAIERTLACGEPVTLADALEDAELSRRESVLAGGIRALVCLPLAVLDEVLGVVYADSRSPGGRFTELDLEILAALATHASLAVAVATNEAKIRALKARLPGQVEETSAGSGRLWREITAVGPAGSEVRP